MMSEAEQKPELVNNNFKQDTLMASERPCVYKSKLILIKSLQKVSNVEESFCWFKLLLFPFVAEAKSGRMQKSRKRKLEQEKEEINGNVEIKMVG